MNLKLPAEKNQNWIAWAVLLIAGIGIVFASWSAFRQLPHWSWSASRLAASFRLAYGFPLYTPPGGVAMNDWFYGPVAAIAYLPVTLAGDPLGALRVAALCNAAYFLLPAGLVIGGRFRDGTPAWAAWACLIFCVGAMLLPFGLWYGAASLHVDTVAIGLGVLSCVTLARHRCLSLAAACCVLTAWTKQIDVPLAVAQLIFLIRFRGRRTAMRYLGWLIAWGAVVTAGFCGWFGGRVLWHDLVILPGRFPIEIDRLAGELAGAARYLWWIVGVALVVWKCPSQAVDDDKGRQLGWLLCLVALVLFPLGLLATLKYGGAQNSLHSLAYGTFGATVLVLTLIRAGAGHRSRLVCGALLVGVLLVTGLNLKRALADEPWDSRWIGEQHREAFEFAKAHPNETYFPWDPLIALMAEHRDYPFESGYHDWLMAHDAPPPAAIRGAFPPTLNYVIYYRFDQRPLDIMDLFPEFSHRQLVGDWVVFSRPNGNPIRDDKGRPLAK